VSTKYTFSVLAINLTSVKLSLYGEWFNYKTGNGLYLSGNNLNTHYVDLYSGIKNLSANNVPFSGIPIENFEITNNYVLEFTLPNFLIKGKYDIIYCNPAGYYKASNNKKFNYINVVGFDNKQFVTIGDNDTNILTINGNQIVTISKYY
jgi:hypothetical protein